MAQIICYTFFYTHTHTYTIAVTNILWVICPHWKKAIIMSCFYFFRPHTATDWQFVQGLLHHPSYGSWMDPSHKQFDYILTLHESLFIKRPSPTYYSHVISQRWASVTRLPVLEPPQCINTWGNSGLTACTNCRWTAPRGDSGDKPEKILQILVCFLFLIYRQAMILFKYVKI